ncbi:uncharacterized protein SCODWIG_01701 [Saccharomycodes ludwigii]|uniref:Pre-mRNA-splicing factor SYF1 n=1 Tax=Saccharomycodes ludwigii TaxID=36035 RepID=A0A376B762_9ASCO|nr:hypothetical protein SCDLUD_003298 [Saccharomycodes ludwigii]KAH3900325.1 hypothetical protein SCDLUD_003298 [Saccharomycodes ludwigii]SSD59940.1 uncharacterized protein SCODWIG_01701 [Saccharomycodes ludwigii]
MDELAKYITSDADIAFEYELFEHPNDELIWKRYLNHIKKEYEGPELNNTNRVAFIYERFLNNVSNKIELWLEYIAFLKNIEPLGSPKLLNIFQLALSKLTRDNVEKKITLWINYLNYLFEADNLQLFDKEFTKCMRSLPLDRHVEIWECTVLTYIKNKYQDSILYFDQNDEVTNHEFSLEQEEEKEKEEETYGEDPNELYYIGKMLGIPVEMEEEIIPDNWSALYLFRYAILIKNKIDSHTDLEKIYKVLRFTNDFEIIKDFLQEFIFPWKRPDVLYYKYLDCLMNLLGTDASPDVIDFEKKIKEALEQYPSSDWIFVKLLARFYIRAGTYNHFVGFIDSILSIVGGSNGSRTLKCFNVIYEYYIHVEEKIIEILINIKEDDWKESIREKISTHFQKLEKLINEYALKLNSFKLKDDINNISLWTSRVKLGNNIAEKQKFYEEAMLAINPWKIKIKGELGHFLCEYSRIFENSLESFREAMNTLVKIPFRYIDDLELLYIKWANLEIKYGEMNNAIKVVKYALKYPEDFEKYSSNSETLLNRYYNVRDNGENSGDEKVPAQVILPIRSFKLWDFLLKLELAFQYTEQQEIIEIFEAMIKMKVAKPITFVMYSDYLSNLSDNNQELFANVVRKVYERAISHFNGSSVVLQQMYEIYLDSALKNYKYMQNTNDRELLRELFDDIFTNLSLKHHLDCSNFYLKNGEVETTLGNFHFAFENVYLKGIKDNHVSIDNKITLWNHLLKLSKSHLSLDITRSLYEECLLSIPNSKCADFIIDFAKLEIAVNEFTRARAILKYGVQLASVLTFAKVWDFWREFELDHGDRNTFKDILKLKRSTEEKFVIETEKISNMGDNIQFVSSGTVGGNAPSSNKKDKTHTSPSSLTNNEIELEL